MSEFYKYTDVELLYKVPEIFISRVVVQEKVDGTNMRFGIYHNRFYIGGSFDFLGGGMQTSPSKVL